MTMYFTASCDPAIRERLAEVPWGAVIGLGDHGIRVMPTSDFQKVAALKVISRHSLS